MSEQILTKATGMFGIVVAILLICVGVYFLKRQWMKICLCFFIGDSCMYIWHIFRN